MLSKADRAAGYKQIERVRKCRRNNLRALAAQYISWRQFAAVVGESPSLLSQIAGGNPTRAIGEELARKLEERLGLTTGYLDEPHP
jgi:hypothetical protein